MKESLKKVTLRDLAKSAKVSVTVASRVMSNYGYVSQQKKKKVRDIAKKLGYSPNIVARSLKTEKTLCIGVVIADITTNFFTLAVRGIDDVARQNGYHLIICNSDENAQKEREHIDELWNRKVDGIILSPTEGNRHRLKMITRAGMPLVLIDRKIQGIDVPSVTVDNRLGAYEGVNHLIEQGYRRTAIINGLAGISALEDRLAGYKKALEQGGIVFEPQFVKYGELNSEISRRRTVELLEMKKRPDSFFITCEAMIVGTIEAIREKGLRIPEDVGIVGFDDPLWAHLLEPPLTAIRQPSYSVGTIAAQTLISEIKGNRIKAGADKDIILRPELVIRGSCGEQQSSSANLASAPAADFRR